MEENSPKGPTNTAVAERDEALAETDQLKKRIRDLEMVNRGFERERTELIVRLNSVNAFHEKYWRDIYKNKATETVKEALQQAERQRKAEIDKLSSELRSSVGSSREESREELKQYTTHAQTEFEKLNAQNIADKEEALASEQCLKSAFRQEIKQITAEKDKIAAEKDKIAAEKNKLEKTVTAQSEENNHLRSLMDRLVALQTLDLMDLDNEFNAEGLTWQSAGLIQLLATKKTAIARDIEREVQRLNHELKERSQECRLSKGRYDLLCGFLEDAIAQMTEVPTSNSADTEPTNPVDIEMSDSECGAPTEESIKPDQAPEEKATEPSQAEQDLREELTATKEENARLKESYNQGYRKAKAAYQRVAAQRDTLKRELMTVKVGRDKANGERDQANHSLAQLQSEHDKLVGEQIVGQAMKAPLPPDSHEEERDFKAVDKNTIRQTKKAPLPKSEKKQDYQKAANEELWRQAMKAPLPPDSDEEKEVFKAANKKLWRQAMQAPLPPDSDEEEEL